jgi:hypothetical protein
MSKIKVKGTLLHVFVPPPIGSDCEVEIPITWEEVTTRLFQEGFSGAEADEVLAILQSLLSPNTEKIQSRCGENNERED